MSAERSSRYQNAPGMLMLLGCVLFVLPSGAGGASPGFLLPGAPRSARGVLIGYPDIGITFSLKSLYGGVDGVYVFLTARQDERAVGEGEVVPGVGAFGVRLGDSAEALNCLDAKRRSYSTSRSRGQATYVYCELSDGGKAIAIVDHDHVSSLLISGRFRTPEGVTQASNGGDIVRAYGPPDILWSVEPERTSLRGCALLLTMPLSGCVAGLVLTCFRKRQRPVALVLSAARATVVGGLCSAMGVITGTAVASGRLAAIKAMEPRFILMIGIAAAISGGLPAGLLDLLQGRLTSRTRITIALAALLLINFLSGCLVFYWWPRFVLTMREYTPMGLVMAFFVLGLFVFGRGEARRTVPGEAAENC